MYHTGLRNNAKLLLTIVFLLWGLGIIYSRNDVGEELRNFLLYVAKGEAVDDFTSELEAEVEAARKNKGWEVEYMTLRMIELEKFNEGNLEGKLEGKLETLINLVQDGILEFAEAAKRSSLSEEEFEVVIEKYEESGKLLQ